MENNLNQDLENTKTEQSKAAVKQDAKEEQESPLVEMWEEASAAETEPGWVRSMDLRDDDEFGIVRVLRESLGRDGMMKGKRERER